MKFRAEEKFVKVEGRTVFRDEIRYLGYSATAVSFTFRGKRAAADIISDPEHFFPEQYAYIAVYINDAEEPEKRVVLDQKEQRLILFEGEEEAVVTIKIMKYSESENAICGIREIEIDGELLEPPKRKKLQIQAIGDSITCGYGVEGSLLDLVHRTAVENPTKTYAYLVAKELDAELEIVAWSGKGVISGYIGEEEDFCEKEDSWLVPMFYDYTDAGLEKQYFGLPREQWEKWDYSSLEPDLIMVHLGTNDSSYTRGVKEKDEEFQAAYERFLEHIHDLYPSAKLLCMLGIMDRRLCAAAEGATRNFSLKNPDAQAAYMTLPEQTDEDGYGTFWHPTPAVQERAAKAVVEKVRELCFLS